MVANMIGGAVRGLASMLSMYDGFGNFRFMVSVDDIYFAAFSEFTLPDLEVETQEITEGGQNQFVHTLPVRVKIGNATLARGLTRDDGLLTWFDTVLQGRADLMYRQVNVIMFKDNFFPLWSFTFYNAFPTKWSGPKFEADGSTIALETLEFAHHGVEIDQLDVDMLGLF